MDGRPAAALPTRPLGRTGIQLTTLGFGCTGLGNLYRSQTEDAVMATVQAAHGAGITYFDTAPLYGFGLAEHRMGAALRRIAGPVVLSTKAGWQLGRHDAADGPGSAADSLFEHRAPFKPRIDYSYDGVMRSFEDSLQRLGTDRVTSCCCTTATGATTARMATARGSGRPWTAPPGRWCRCAGRAPSARWAPA